MSIPSQYAVRAHGVDNKYPYYSPLRAHGTLCCMAKPVFLFDCSEVLLRGLKGTEELLAVETGIAPRNIHEQFHDPAINQLFVGNISEDEYWETLITRYGWDIDVSSPKAAVRKNFAEIAGTR